MTAVVPCAVLVVGESGLFNPEYLNRQRGI
jgi:hypothetical protein